jgi:CBS domain-containing protein
MPNDTARELMNKGCECVSSDATIRTAAKKMADLGVGALPICGPEDKLIGMLTDRDIVVKCIAEGLDIDACTAGELADGEVFWVFESATADEVIGEMESHQVRRLIVLNEDKRLAGIISQGDVATQLGERATGELVGAVSQGPADQN